MRTDGFKSLVVWQKSMDFSAAVYKLTEGFPKHELYGLISQIRRAVVSIPANIAEGYGRTSRKEELQFLSIANGSLMEVETFLLLALRLGYVSDDQFVAIDVLRKEVGNLLNGYRRSKQV